MLSFCFFPPGRAGERGIERFFRHWGGEALYNSHEKNSVTSPVISRIGTPSIVEAEVPVALLKSSAGLALKVVLRFLKSRGHLTNKPVDLADCVNRPLPADCIRRIIRFPDLKFVSLTGCDTWRSPLQQ